MPDHLIDASERVGSQSGVACERNVLNVTKKLASHRSDALVLPKDLSDARERKSSQ